jgi:multidrug efflux pump subunit AcrA (membrane-fusion protein)
VKRNIWHLPVELPYVRPRRRLGYVIYAILSGLYSYSILYVFARFIGNIARNFSADWGFLFEYATAYLIFRGRIRTLGNFMKFVYLDKKDRIAHWFNPTRKAVLAAAALVFVFLPIWHETAVGRFMLEPGRVAGIRALVPGTVARVYADEGQQVVAGAPLFQMTNVRLDAKVARSQSDLAMATEKAYSEFLHYADFGAAVSDRDRLGQQARQFSSEAASLTVNSPISGVVLTPHLNDKLGSSVPEGGELAEIGELTQLRARVYVSEFDMYKFRADSPARLQIDGMWGKPEARTVRIAPLSSDIAPGLLDLSKYKGQSPPKFYIFDLFVENPAGKMRPGMAGTARLYGARRSLAGLATRTVWEFLRRKIW